MMPSQISAWCHVTVTQCEPATGHVTCRAGGFSHRDQGSGTAHRRGSCTRCITDRTRPPDPTAR
eukprot:scaffold451_cov124-Isochrysis_galbana.AAC.3